MQINHRTRNYIQPPPALKTIPPSWLNSNLNELGGYAFLLCDFNCKLSTNLRNTIELGLFYTRLTFAFILSLSLLFAYNNYNTFIIVLFGDLIEFEIGWQIFDGLLYGRRYCLLCLEYFLCQHWFHCCGGAGCARGGGGGSSLLGGGDGLFGGGGDGSGGCCAHGWCISSSSARCHCCLPLYVWARVRIIMLNIISHSTRRNWKWEECARALVDCGKNVWGRAKPTKKKRS